MGYHMNDINQNDIKQRIFDRAVSLFARKSYGSVGVREIAREAGVSISMISYYFGGKVGILKAIINKYFSLFETMFNEVIREEAPFEANIRCFIDGCVNLIRQEHDLSLVWISELNNEIPEVAELKALNQKKIAASANRLLGQVGLNFDRDQELISIIGPALIQMIFSHFISGGMLEYSSKIKFDEAYFKRYVDTLSELCLNGIKGIFPVAGASGKAQD